MKVKVSLFDHDVASYYVKVISPIGVICSIVFIAVDIPPYIKCYCFIGIIFSLALIYFGVWIYANCSKQKKLSVDGSTLLVRVGDIFQENSLIVIPFNEYFDTQVDDEIISRRSLNGQFIERYVQDRHALDTEITNDLRLEKHIVLPVNREQSSTKPQYELGSIHKFEDKYFLLAFSHFNGNSEAYLSMRDYVNCLMTMWEEIDILYAGRSVVIPLLGGGITRFRNMSHISDEELLQLIIWSFRISGVKFSPPAKITIVISEQASKKINFFKLHDFD